MKKIAIASLLICFLVSSCKKGNDVASQSSDAVKTTTAAADVKPTASFRISNLVSPGMILEGNITDFENTSQNGDTYLWDFGNGITSTQKIPNDISFVPCGGTYSISLTVKNKLGDVATSSQAYTILCRGKNAHNTPVVHLPTAAIHAYVLTNE
ncbi:MAG: PKD domain-containing protein [Ferruginibacter sp.]